MKKTYKYLLWDIDDTLVDFKSSERMALKACFKEAGVELAEQQVEVYSEINRNYWKMLEQGKIEKPIMLVKRFEDFVEYLSKSGINCEEINDKYQVSLGDYAVMVQDAYEICAELKGSYKQYALSNGTAIAQYKKLHKTGLIEILDGVFISDEVGYEKPDVRFFNHVGDNIPNFNPNEALMIGDALSSDMTGANNAGIDCCWFNPKGRVNPNKSIKIDYEIKELKEVFKLVK